MCVCVECQKAGWKRHNALCVWLREAVTLTKASVKSGKGMSQEAVADMVVEQLGDARLHESLHVLPAVLQSLLQECPSAASKREINGDALCELLDVSSRGSALNVFRLLLQKCPAAASKVDTNNLLPLRHHACTHVAMRANTGLDQVEVLIQAYPAAVNVADIHGALPMHLAVLFEAGLEVVRRRRRKN